MDEHPTLKKVASTILGVFTILLLGFGFTVLGYLGYRVYKNPPQKIGGLSRGIENISVPGPSSNALRSTTTSLQSNPVQSSSSASPSSPKVFTLDDFRLAIQTSTNDSFTGPDYSQIRDFINQATPESDQQKAYQEYKAAYSLMSNAYQTTKNQQIKYVMIEIRTYCTNLSGFNSSDMQIPS